MLLRPGDCVVVASGGSGVVLGVKEGVCAVRKRGGIVVEVAAGEVSGPVKAAEGLEVMFGVEKKKRSIAARVSPSEVEMESGEVVAASEVECPMARAAPIVACVVRAARSAVSAASATKEQALSLVESARDSVLKECSSSNDEKSSSSLLRKTVEGSRAGRAAMGEVEAVASLIGEADGALATLGRAASEVSKSNDKLAATAKKVATRLASSKIADDAHIEAAFSRAIEGSTEGLSALSRRLGAATAAFATGEEADLESAVAKAVAQAPAKLVAELSESADYYAGELNELFFEKVDEVLLSGRLAETPLKEALNSLGEGASVGETLAAALDDERAARAVSGAGRKLAEALEAIDGDARAQHFASRLLEDQKNLGALVESLASLDVEAASERLEVLASDASERRKLAEKTTDSALEFFLTHLPAMPVPPIELERDGIRYSLGDLNLSKFKLSKDDVKVDLPLLDLAKKKNEDSFFFFEDSRQQQPPPPQFAAAAAAAAFARAEEDPTSSGVRVRRISAAFEGVSWRFKQTYFPYLEGSGTADVLVEDGAAWMEVGARRRCGKPVAALTRCDVSIGGLEVRVENQQVGWLLNALSSLFREHVRAYVEKSLRNFLRRNATEGLRPLDAPLAAAWPAVANVFRALPDPSTLPPAIPASLAGDPDVVCLEFRDAGPLGLQLARRDDGLLQVAAVIPGSQASRLLGKRSIAGGIIAAVDELLSDVDDVVERVASRDRPKLLCVRQPPQKKLFVVEKAPAPSWRTVEMVPKSYPGRPVSPLGIKLRAHPTVSGCVEVARDNNARGLRGKLVVACNGEGLVGLPDATAVGARVRSIAAAAAADGDALAIAVSDPTDVLVDAPPRDAVFHVHAGYFVLAALKPAPSPLEIAGARVGDVVLAVDDARLPTPGGYARDVQTVLRGTVVAAAKERTAFDLTLSGDRRLSVGPLDHPKLGATFSRDPATGAPRLKRFDGIPGPLARSRAWQEKLVRPGLALVALVKGGVTLLVDPATTVALDSLLDDDAVSAGVFRDVEVYDTLRARFSRPSSSSSSEEEEKKDGAPSSSHS